MNVPMSDSVNSSDMLDNSDVESNNTHISDDIKRREIKSFVLRQGRMTTAQQRGYDECWGQWGLELEAGSLNMNTAFGREGPIVLEIGYGMGLSLVAMRGQKQRKTLLVLKFTIQALAAY